MIFRALDLFSGAGGATRGLQMAGFHVTGIDIRKQPRYVGDAFIQADALRPPVDLRAFDFIWASPPCQAYTVAQNAAKNAHAHPRLIVPTRHLAQASGLPYCIENVVGAPLQSPVTLCGLSFGLKVFRHRLFECSFPVLTPPHTRHERGATIRGEVFSVFGGAGGCHRTYTRPDGTTVSFKRGSREQWSRAMGIDWMTRVELAESIPPAYSHFIGKQVMRILTEERESRLVSAASHRAIPQEAPIG